MFVPKFATDDTQAGSLPGSNSEVTTDDKDIGKPAGESADSNNAKADPSAAKNNTDNKEASTTESKSESNKPDEDDALFPHQSFKYI